MFPYRRVHTLTTSVIVRGSNNTQVHTWPHERLQRDFTSVISSSLLAVVGTDTPHSHVTDLGHTPSCVTVLHTPSRVTDLGHTPSCVTDLGHIPQLCD